jgi:Beta-lactamase
LSHRSGIGDYLDENNGHQIDDYVMAVPVHELAESNDYRDVLDGHPSSSPGERFTYNNAGFVLLAAILAERAAGTAFVDWYRSACAIRPASPSAPCMIPTPTPLTRSSPTGQMEHGR